MQKVFKTRGKLVLRHWVMVVEHHYSLSIPLELLNIGADYYSSVKTGFLASTIRCYGHLMKLDVPLGLHNLKIFFLDLVVVIYS